MSDELRQIPLPALKPSAANVRRTNSKAEIEALAASIEAHGLLQNLTVQPGKADDTYEVVAGGRRLAALKLLVKQKRLPKGTTVLCRIMQPDGGNAGELSLAENVMRTALHPADQFVAFSRLQAEGLGAEEIAARFGVSPTIVRQRLKLAAVSSKLMDAYREGNMSLDQLTAFTISDDHEAQERVWFDLPGQDRSPYRLRRALTTALVEGSDRRALFVGAEGYEAAGGIVIRDLFRPDDEAYFADSELLDRIAAEKLAAEAQEIEKEGWAWVEVQQTLDYEHLARFGRMPPQEVALTPEEEERIAVATARYDELVENLEESPPAETVAELDRLDEEIRSISEPEPVWADDAKVTAGAIVSIEHDGSLSVLRGLVRPEDRTSNGADARPARERKAPANGELPDVLREELSAHRTVALRISLARKPDVALLALVHVLVLRTFYDSFSETCIDLRPHEANLGNVESLRDAPAVVAFSEAHGRWMTMLPAREDLWRWLGDQTTESRLELLACCVARTVNATWHRTDRRDVSRYDQAELLARAVELDMAEWWQPTREHFFERLPKAQILAAVADASSPQVAENIAKLKKPAMAARAEELVANKRWLPDMLRLPALAAE